MKKNLIICLLFLLFCSNIFAASISIKSPKKGDIWTTNKQYTIKWSRKGKLTKNVKITLLNGNKSVLTIVPKTQNTGSYKWTIPDSVREGKYYILISTIDKRTKGKSNVFTIKKDNNKNIINDKNIIKKTEDKRIDSISVSDKKDTQEKRGYTSVEMAIAKEFNINLNLSVYSSVLLPSDAAIQLAKNLKEAGKSITDVAKRLKEEGFCCDLVCNALITAFALPEPQIIAALVSAEFTAEDIASTCKHILQYQAEETIRALKTAGFSLLQVARAIQSTHELTTVAIFTSLRAVGYATLELTRIAKESFGFTKIGVVALADAIGCSLNDTVEAMKAIYNISAKEMARCLRITTHSFNAIANVLKGDFNQSARNCAKIFKEISCSANVTASVLKAVYNTTGKTAAGHLKNAGYTALQTTRALKNAFSAGWKSTATWLKEAGWGFKKIVDVIIEAFNKGYTDIVGFIKDLF